MKITANGEVFEFSVETKKLIDFLQENGNYWKNYVISVNGVIVTNDKYDAVLLKDSDSLDIFSFVGGG